MGTVKIRDGRDVAEYEVAAVDGVLRVDLDASDGPRVEAYQEQRRQATPPTVRAALAALLGPAAATLLAALVGIATGFSVFDPARAGWVAHALRAGWFGIAAAGTLWLVADASRRTATDDEWTPNPWRYVGTGALALTAVYVTVTGVPSETPLQVLAGVFVAAGFASSVVVGPVYFLVLRRHAA